MTSAQIEDWLRERHPSLKVSESTVRSYVRNLRKEYNIPRELNSRSYEAVPEMEMGEQMQVDFGETWQDTPDKRKVKLYFIAFVLSHSRYKYMEWLDRPFTTRDLLMRMKMLFVGLKESHKKLYTIKILWSHTTTQKRDVTEYLAVLEGQK